MNGSREGTKLFEQHPIVTLAAAALVGAIVMLTLAEIAARVLLPQWAPPSAERARFWRYDEVLGWSHRPGQRGRFVHPDFSVSVTINSHGLRDTEYSLQRTERKRRMLILGDSFGWGFGVEHQEIFTELLEEEHRDWQFINASVSGYGTAQQFLYLKERGLSFSPDVILLLFYENDFAENIRGEEYWYYKPYFVLKDGNLQVRNYPVPASTLRQKMDRFFVGKTYLWRKAYMGSKVAIKHVLDLSRRDGGGGDNSNGPYKERIEYEVTYQLLKAVNDLAADNDARLIIVSVPMDEEKRRVLETVSQREAIPYLALDPFFATIDQAVSFPHNVHWNAVGHRVAATAISQYLRALTVF